MSSVSGRCSVPSPEAMRRSIKADSLYEGRALCGVPILFSPLCKRNDEALFKASLNGFDYLPLFTYCDGALVSASHPLAQSESVTRAALLDYPVVSSSIEQLAPLRSYLGPEHISSAIADLSTRLQVIQDGESIIFMPPFSEVAGDPRYRFLPIEDAYEVEIGFLHDRNELDDSDVRELLSPLLALYAAHEQAGLCKVTAG